MTEEDELLTPEDVAIVRQRRLEAENIARIVGNPLTAEDVAMFEMFERERWSPERCRAYIHEKNLEYLASRKRDE